MRVPINLILFPEPVTAGMDLDTLVILSRLMRRSNEDPSPVVLRPERKFYTLTDGRHRVVAAMMAGRKDVLAEIEVP